MAGRLFLKWIKKTVHKKVAYGKAVIELTDIGGNLTESVTLEKAFVVSYEQCFDGEKGAREFSLLLHGLDHLEDMYGESFSKERTFIIPDAEVSLAAFMPLDAEYASGSYIEKYREKLSGLSNEDLEKEKNTSYQTGGNFPAQLSDGDRKKLIEEEEKKRQNTNSINIGFKRESWLGLAEGRYPYIYSTKDIMHKPWTGNFDANADLTFGTGHSIKSEEEFKKLKEYIESHTDAELQAKVKSVLKDDLKKAVERVNSFLKDHSDVRLEQY